MSYAVEMLKVTKVFGSFKANDEIELRVKQGEVHALLGENGAGKSTLMNLLFGFYKLDGGSIKINNKDVEITDPNMANELGIGMVHQHFKLVKPFTVTQNIVLGSEPTKGLKLDLNEANEKVQSIIDEYDFQINATDKISNLSVGQQQKVEILKMLYKDADILIFDEPTGALTPQETKELLEIIKKLQKQGKTIIIITHKLNEIKAVADRCTIIRLGRSIDTVEVADTSEEQLAELMVGRSVNFEVTKEDVKPGEEILTVDKLDMHNVRGIHTVKAVSFSARRGEILGVAGVDGNGQIELIEGITGLSPVTSGDISFKGENINNASIRERNEMHICHIPQDRHRHGLVLDYTISENAVLNEYFKAPYSKTGVLNYDKINERGQYLVDNHDIRSPHGISTTVRDMSGGNQQKLIIAREIGRNPELLIAVQPTRGVDVGAIENIHNQLLEERSKEKAIILVSLELEEVLKLSDRIAVMHNGELMDIVDAKDATEEKIGLLMAGKR